MHRGLTNPRAMGPLGSSKVGFIFIPPPVELLRVTSLQRLNLHAQLLDRRDCYVESEGMHGDEVNDPRLVR